MTHVSARQIARPAWLERPEVQALWKILPELRFVGGAVRNTVLGRPVAELDAAVPIPPPETISRLRTVGIRVVPTGLAHGTITAIIGGETIEITTLRRDVETDGRHAVVSFTDDWEADAARRDFTMNALYLDASGTLWDPVHGYDDCIAGLVRFVGEPARRIEEDALRLLRFYRMHAWYGRGQLDIDGRQACRGHVGALGRLSGERIRNELLKLLAASDPGPSVMALQEDGVLPEILSGPVDPRRLAALVALEPEPDALRRLAALVSAEASAEIARRLRLSSRQTERLIAMTAAAPNMTFDLDPRAHKRLLYRLGADLYRDRLLLAAAETGVTEISPLLDFEAEWRRPVFPISGGDALALGIEAGPALGKMLAEVEAWWLEGDFMASKEACLDRLMGARQSLNKLGH